MKLFKIAYNHTVYVRTPTHGGMDSDFSHTEVRKDTKNILAPNKELAVAYLNTSAANSRDSAYTILDIAEDRVDVIIQIDHGLGPTLR